MTNAIMIITLALLFLFARDAARRLSSDFFRAVFAAPVNCGRISLTVYGASLTALLTSLCARISTVPERTADARTICYSLLISVLLVPLCEEFFFRGILMGALKRFGVLPAAVGSVFLFAVFHGAGAFPYAVCGGLLITGFTVLSGTYRTGVVLHYANNLFAFLLLVVPDQWRIWLYTGCALTAAIAGSVILYQNYHSKKGNCL